MSPERGRGHCARAPDPCNTAGDGPIRLTVALPKPRAAILHQRLAGRLRTAPEQTAKCDVQDMLKALGRLRVEHREALLLIVAEELSYEDAARVCGVPVGTMKSRVNRARVRLAQLLAVEDTENFGVDQVTQAALQTAL